MRSDDTEPETRAYLRQLWSQWWKVRNDCLRWLEDRQLPRWKLKTIRPGNHPQRRLGALAALLRSWSSIVAPLADATRWSQAAWRETLLTLTHDFWTTHYTLLAESGGKAVALIGETRVQEMLANVAYPLLVPERTRLWAEYTSNSPPCSTIKRSAAPCCVSLAMTHAAKTSPRSCTTSRACCKSTRTSASKTTPPAPTARSRKD